MWSCVNGRFEEMRQERIVKYQGMNLYVKNLSDEVDDDRLREQFSLYGTVTSAKVGGPATRMPCICLGV